MEDEKRTIVRSILRFKGSVEHHNKTFTCQAQNQPSPEIMITHIRIQLTYAPMGQVDTYPPTIREFDTFHAFCRVNASPPVTNYMWYLDGQLFVGESHSELVIFNVSRLLHQSVISCHVENDVGRGRFGNALLIFCKYTKYIFFM